MSIYRRKGSPNWWSRICVAGTKNRRTTGTTDRGEAQEFDKCEAQRLWRLHKLGDRGSVLWTQAASRWLAELPQSSRNKEESILNWFDEELKEQPLRAIDRDAVTELRVTLTAEGKGPARANRYMANLRAVLRKSVQWGYLDAAPHVPMVSARAPEMRWLTRPQLKKLCTHLPAHLALAAEFAVNTGLRMRSMLKLTWDRIDLRHRRLWIPGTQMKGRQPLGIPLSRDACRILRKLKTLNPDGPNVFQYNGQPIDDCNTRAFQNAVETSGLEPLRWHDLRHTFAAWAIQSGVTVPELMQLGGWRTYSMALRYAHLAPDHLAKATERIARFGHSRKKAKRKKA